MFLSIEFPSGRVLWRGDRTVLTASIAWPGTIFFQYDDYCFYAADAVIADMLSLGNIQS